MTLCAHERYKTKDYMLHSNALKRRNRNEKIRIGSIVTNCEDCGEDISRAKRVKVEVIKNSVIKYNIIVRSQKSSMICYDGETIEEAEIVCKVKFGKYFEGISK